MAPKETIRSIGGGVGLCLSLPLLHTYIHTCTVHTPFNHLYKMTESLKFVEGLQQKLFFGEKVNLPAEMGQ